MEWLNYHHLRYFWAAAREGGVTRAAERLHISQPTVSGQIRALEEAIGEKLLVKQGRGLVLTDAGRVALRYADEIFGLGQELLDAMKGRPTGRPARLVVGIANALPKLVAYRVLAPALSLDVPVIIQCIEDRAERLLAEVALRELDLVLSDVPVGPGSPVKAFNHVLGESGVTVFGTRALARAHRRTFPASLDGAPMLVPTYATSLRRALDDWTERTGVRPRIVGEFEDSALLKTFGETGAGLFPAPTVIAADIRRRHRVAPLGELPGVRERFYLISPERRLTHPAVLAITRAAREVLFS